MQFLPNECNSIIDDLIEFVKADLKGMGNLPFDWVKLR